MRVVALVPGLMFGSRVASLLEAAGHDVTLAPSADRARAAVAGADALVVDLGAGSDPEALALGGAAPRTLAVYSHVEADVRRRAEQAGFDLVVPRSRMAREGAELVARLDAA